MRQYIALALFALAISAPTSAQTHEVEPTRKERKLQTKIALLDMQLEQSRAELAQSLFDRGVDTTTRRVVEVEEVEEEPQLEESHEEVNFVIDFLPQQMDSLVSVWKERESRKSFDLFFDEYISFETDVDHKSSKALDTLYKQRLENLASPISLPYNSIVRSYIDRYTSPKSSLMSSVLTRSQYYLPLIEEELIKHDLPLELRAMPIIESALSITARSPMGAVGLWQFMPSTGKMYSLEINSLVDERCDHQKSTIAACRFMSDLYKMYGDWILAIAAYNCGPGNVNKAMARSGRKQGTFWDIYDFLPRETRGYVPAFIAASYAYAYHKEHNISFEDNPLPMATDTITVSRIMHLGQVAETLSVPIDILRQLNPQYRKDIIPATTKSYLLRLPQCYVSPYIENEMAIHEKDSTYLKEYISPANIEKLRSSPSGGVYVVRSGDTLSAIAKRYRVTTRQIMSWNNLRSADRISIGQRLRIGD